MRGGQYLNNWRMAELHAKEAPDRVRELEAWGAVFDRTKDGQDPAAQLRRPRLPAPGPRGRPHRAGDDPHASRITACTRASTCTWSARSPSCSRTAIGWPGAFGYDRERGRFPSVQGQGGHPGLPGGIGRAFKITSNSWEYTGDGQALAYRSRRRAHRHGVRPVPPDRHGLAALGARHPRHRGRAGRRRHPEQQRGARFMFDDIPELYVDQTADSTPRAGAT